MQKLTEISGIAAPLDRDNVDTDQIIPKQFLKRIERTGFGKYLFFDWRYLQSGGPDPGFELNRPGYEGAAILIAGKNFGCGSSREHAPWALLDYGFRVIIAPSYADIFYNNCFKNGILPVTLPDSEVTRLLENAKTHPGYRLDVSLENQEITDDSGFRASFEVEPFRRHCLLNGLDDIELTLQHEAAITSYESRRPDWLPRVQNPA
ncbi:MAG TPA: 3-isopropylmalate dehydratase small subunit [Armatimonadota bacterium]|nr:3-isopropylmalate dehydratase small subunit [Armatimonadota bacterium]